MLGLSTMLLTLGHLGPLFKNVLDRAVEMVGVLVDA
jgi:hypothetical protein